MTKATEIAHYEYKGKPQKIYHQRQVCWQPENEEATKIPLRRTDIDLH